MNAVTQRAITAPPAIGQPWPGEGGIYAGISRGENGEPDAHLIVAHDTIPRADWQTACAQAKAHTADGHQDFRAPTRSESALCHANLKTEFCAAHDGWYWTNSQGSAHFAWAQYFGNGGQFTDLFKDSELHVRPVRRSILQPFNPSLTAAPEPSAELSAA